MTSCLYVLHFLEPLSHAKHYAGCTSSLFQRLEAHATGSGSKICKVLYKIGINWTLAAVYLCSKVQMRRLERQLKNCHDLGRWCPLCSGQLTQRPMDTVPYDLANLNFPLRSDIIRAMGRGLGAKSVRPISVEEKNETMLWIRDLMKREKDSVGFIPAGGSEGLLQLQPLQRIAITENAGRPVGYAAWNVDRHVKEKINIYQCVVEDACRNFGHGRLLVDQVQSQNTTCSIEAKVRDDLAANEFWKAVGFTLMTKERHRTSDSLINVYSRPPTTNEDWSGNK